MDEFVVVGDEAISVHHPWLTLGGVHHLLACKGLPCVIHNPSDHHMRDWCLHWRGDRQMFERICPHGVGHPNVDQVSFWERTRTPEDAWGLRVHGCCPQGCCNPPETQAC